MKNTLPDIPPKIISFKELWHFYSLPNFMFAITGKNGLLKHVNPTFVRLSGFSEEHIHTLTFIDLVHPGHQTDAKKQLTSIFSNYDPLVFSCRMQTAGTNPIPIQWTVFCPLHNEHMYFIGQILKEEQRLKDTTLQYESVLYNSPVPIVLFNRTCSQIIEANEAAIEYSGYTDQEFMTLNFFDLFSEDLPSGCQDLTYFKEKRNIHNAINQLIKKTGELIPVAITFSLVDFQDEQYVLAFLKDMEHLPTAQQQLLNDSPEKENVVREATLFGLGKKLIEFGKERHDNINQMLNLVKLYQEAALNNESIRIDLLGREKLILDKNINSNCI